MLSISAAIEEGWKLVAFNQFNGKRCYPYTVTTSPVRADS